MILLDQYVLERTKDFYLVDSLIIISAISKNLHVSSITRSICIDCVHIDRVLMLKTNKKKNDLLYKSIDLLIEPLSIGIHPFTKKGEKT